jgi:nicotinamidase-related amidase
MRIFETPQHPNPVHIFYGGSAMKTGLILVDIQNDYFPGGAVELAGIGDAAGKARDLMALFRERKWPTFHIQHVSARKGAGFFLPGTPGVEINDSVKALPGETVIQKHFPNSFRETQLLDTLKKDGVERVVICGAMSHMCIDATTRAAADLGFACVVIDDACATRDLQFREETIPAHNVHGAFMAALAWGYAKVMNLGEFRQTLLKEVSG